MKYHTVKHLVNHQCRLVREQIAKSRDTPADVLGALAYDEAVEVRRAIAQNPSTPVNILQFLAWDCYWDIRDTAFGRLKRL